MNKTVQQIEADAARKGVNMTDVCRMAGVNYSTWWRWTRSKFEPRQSSIVRIIEALNQIDHAQP